jgi:hypothetical protein
MIPTVPHDINEEQVAAFSNALIEQFGADALSIAEDQAEDSSDGVSAAWKAIGRRILSHQTIDLSSPRAAD